MILYYLTFDIEIIIFNLVMTSKYLYRFNSFKMNQILVVFLLVCMLFRIY